MLNLALRKQIHSTHIQGSKSHTYTYMELQNLSLGFHVLNTKERFSSYNHVEHLKWRWSNLYKPRSRTYIGKNVKLAWNLKEKNYKVMKPNLYTWSTFPWRGEEKNLSCTWRCGMEVENVEKSWRRKVWPWGFWKGREKKERKWDEERERYVKNEWVMWHLGFYMDD